MSPALSRRLFAAASIAVVFLAAALRLPGLSRPAWLDEAHSFARAADPTVVRMAKNAIASQHPPLYFAALRGWIAAFGPSDGAARMLSLLLAIGSLVVLLVTLGTRSPPAGISAGLLFATNPLLVRYGTEIRGYALLILLVLVAAAAAWRLAEEPASGPARAALLIALVSAVLTHVVGAFLLPAVVALVAVAAPRTGRRRALVAIAAPVAAAAAIFVPLAAALAAFRPPRQDWWVPPTTALLVGRCFGSLAGFPAWPAEGRAIQLALGAVTLGCAAAFVIASRERMAVAFLSAAGVFWASIVLTSLLVFPIVLDRLLLPVLPLFVSALTLAAFSRSLAQRGAAGAAVLAIASVWALDVRASFGRPIEDFREAATRIEKTYRPGDAILVFPGFAANALRRYLPDETAHAVRAADAHDADMAAPAVSLLVRPGLDFRSSRKMFSLLLEAIASRVPGRRVRLLLIEPMDGPMTPESALYRDEVVIAARRSFGEPDEESTNGLVYDARWHAGFVRR